MPYISSLRTQKHGISRREFLWLTSMSAAGMLAGCAADPITGRKQLMLVSEDKEIEIDQQHSPHQISSDYGTLQDKALNDYIDETGKKMAESIMETGVDDWWLDHYSEPDQKI